MICKNCKYKLPEDSGYCNRCGGKVIRNRLTFKNLFEHISETFFNYDNKLLRTFIDLFKKPEDVVVGYIKGVRKRYVNVFSYFALALTISGIQIFIIQKFQSDFTFYDTSTAIGKQQQAVFDFTYKLSNDYQSLLMMTYIPIYALIAKLVFLGTRKFNYIETLVIFLYTQAQLSLCIGIISIVLIPFKIIDFTTIGIAIVPVMFIYFVYCLKRIYELSNMQMLLRTLIFLVVFAILFVLLSIITAIIMYNNGAFQELIEAQKAARDSLQ